MLFRLHTIGATRWGFIEGVQEKVDAFPSTYDGTRDSEGNYIVDCPVALSLFNLDMFCKCND